MKPETLEALAARADACLRRAAVATLPKRRHDLEISAGVCLAEAARRIGAGEGPASWSDWLSVELDEFEVAQIERVIRAVEPKWQRPAPRPVEPKWQPPQPGNPADPMFGGSSSGVSWEQWRTENQTRQQAEYVRRCAEYEKRKQEAAERRKRGFPGGWRRPTSNPRNLTRDEPIVLPNGDVTFWRINAFQRKDGGFKYAIHMPGGEKIWGDDLFATVEEAAVAADAHVYGARAQRGLGDDAPHPQLFYGT